MTFSIEIRERRRGVLQILLECGDSGKTRQTESFTARVHQTHENFRSMQKNYKL